MLSSKSRINKDKLLCKIVRNFVVKTNFSTWHNFSSQCFFFISTNKIFFSFQNRNLILKWKSFLDLIGNIIITAKETICSVWLWGVVLLVFDGCGIFLKKVFMKSFILIPKISIRIRFLEILFVKKFLKCLNWNVYSLKRRKLNF